MTAVWSYLVAYLAMAAAQLPLQEGLETLSRGLQKELQVAKRPLEATIVNIGSQQCTNVKKLVGLEYDQLFNKSEPDLSKLTLQLYTPYYNTSYRLGEAAGYIVRDPQFRPEGDLVIFVHGFTDDPSKDSFKEISSAFATAGLGHNVLALDGSSLIGWLYLRSTTYVRFMGEHLGETLAALVNEGMDPARIHLIGHSLGAHVAGFTGRRFLELTGLLLGRVSGLDAAGPCFTAVAADLRLSYKHARYVDVVHTDGGIFGMKEPLGHADYFPNSGELQPHCLLETCSHSRAWLLYAETIRRPRAMPAVGCSGWDSYKKADCNYTDISYLGYASPASSRGLYFLQTAGEAPFGLGEKGVHYQDNEALLAKVGGQLDAFLSG